MGHHDNAAALGRVIGDGLDQPFVWGENDCAYFVANVLAVGLGDARLLGALRERYTTLRGAMSWLDAAGGLHPAASSIATEIGYSEAGEPIPGAVGIVAGALGPSMAVFDGARFWAKGISGGTGFSGASIIWTP